MVPLVRRTAVVAWVDDMTSQLKQGQSIELLNRFFPLTLTPDGVQGKGATLAWRDIDKLQMNAAGGQLTIGGMGNDGRTHTFKFPLALKGTALITMIQQFQAKPNQNTIPSQGPALSGVELPEL